MDLINLVLLVGLIPLCFVEKIETKAITDNAELSSIKSSKVQTTVNQLLPEPARQIVHLLNKQILPTRFRQGKIIRTMPIIKGNPRQQTNYMLNRNGPVQNEFEEQKPYIPVYPHFRIPENDDNKQSVSISKNYRISQLYDDSKFANNDTSLKLKPKKAEFFLESDDDKVNKNINVDSNKSEVIRKQNKSKNVVQTDKSSQQILYTDLETNFRKTSTNTELEDDQLSAEIKKTVITNKDDVDVLKTVVDQLPDLIQSMLSRGVKTPNNLEVGKNKTESDESRIEKLSLETSKSTDINFNRSDDVLKLLLKPILRSKLNESANVADSNRNGSYSDYLVNDIPDSVKFKQLNYEEVTKQKPIKTITPNLKKVKIEMQRKLTNDDHVPTEAPYGNLQHYAYDSPKYNDGYRINPILYGTNLPPYEYPAQDTINANTYTYNLKDRNNPKSDVPEDNRSTIWKSWCNMEVIMRNGENHYGSEKQIKQRHPQNPQILNDYRFDKYFYPNGYNYYQRRYPNSYSNTKVAVNMAQKPQISHEYKFDNYYPNAYPPMRNYYQRQYRYHYPYSYSYSNSWQRYPVYYPIQQYNAVRRNY